MPKFNYTGDEGRVYHDFGLVEPGDERELDENPGDGRWAEASDSDTETIEPAAERNSEESDQ
jgi:hypothetical protein